MNAPQNIRHLAKRYSQQRAKSETLETDSGFDEDESRSLDPFWGMFNVSYPYFFLLLSVVSLYLYDWSHMWWISGAPLLSFTLMRANVGPLKYSPALLIGSLLYVNVAYMLFSTSWLFFRFYRFVSYPTILILFIFLNRRMQRLSRRVLRFVAHQFYFADDKFAFFDLPALDIDTGEVPCLLVVRGFTFTLSTMTLEVHGIEVGVKLSDEIELAIQTDKFVWRIMREISIGDVYGNLKAEPGMSDRPRAQEDQNDLKATDSMTNNRTPATMGSNENATSRITSHYDYDEKARGEYRKRLSAIEDTNTSIRARNEVQSAIRADHEIRAAIGSRLHKSETVPNPPKAQMKSSELEARVPWFVKEIFHKVPVLLRLFLNPVSYNHPVHFKSIVLTCCGKYLNDLLSQHFFKSYDSENKSINQLKLDVEEFLTTGKFNLVLPSILGMASVPFLTHYDIITFIKVPQVLLYKTVELQDGKEVEKVEQAAQLDGLAATFTIPSALLPNYEHLLPEAPAEVTEKDCLDVKMSILGSLPGKFHESMIEFAMTILKASQVLTLHQNATSMSNEVENFNDFTVNVGKAFVEQTKKKLVEAHVNDQWLQKLIHKGINAIRSAKGDFGYQLDIPVDLADLRPKRYVSRAEKHSSQGSRITSDEPGSCASSLSSHTSTGSQRT